MAATISDAISMYHHFSDEKEQRFPYLRIFLKSILSNIFTEEGDQELYNLLLTDSSLEIWERAFTHESYDPINNYEVYETIGDAVLGNIFLNFLMDMYKDQVNARNLTLTKNKYMASEEQIQMANSLKLNEMIRLGPNRLYDRKMAEDVFEAFFGVLTRLIDNVEVEEDGRMVAAFRGESYRWTFQLLAWILGDKHISLVTSADPITRIKEAYDVLSMVRNVRAPVVKETTYNRKGSVWITMEFVETILDDSGKAVAKMKWPDKVEGPVEQKAQLHQRLGEMGLEYLERTGRGVKEIERIRASKEDSKGELQEALSRFHGIVDRLNSNNRRNYNSTITGYEFESLPVVDNIFYVRLWLNWSMENEIKKSGSVVGSGVSRTAAQIDAVRQFNEKYS